MICSLVEVPGRHGVGNRDSTGEEVRRAGEDKGDLLVEVEGADDGGEEVLEASCADM